MTYRELCAIKKAITSKREILEQLKSNAYSTAAKLDRSPHKRGQSDKVGSAAGNIVDLEREISELNEEYGAALSELPRENCAANCIYLRVVCEWNWKEIADKLHNNKDAIRKACSRFKW